MPTSLSERHSNAPRVNAEPVRIVADAVLLDIEGTIAPISFVRDTLFPYARARLEDYVAENANSPAVQEIMAQATSLADGRDAVPALLDWHDRDIKAPPLKALQGLIWDSGYRSGAFKSPIFPDALDAMKQWKTAGLPLYIYSSGSIPAQALFFEFNAEGDLRPLFSDHFDTTIGTKTDPEPYRLIAEKIKAAPGSVVFFSDNAKELAAARSAGLQTIHVAKDETAHSSDFIEISDYSQVVVNRAERAGP